MEKVRYAEMLPHEILSRRIFPAAFIGLGGLEWHGEHQAVGLDALKAETLCELAAARSGGFAFPTLWYLEMKAVCLFGGHGPMRDFAQPVVERFNAAFRDTQAHAGHEVDYAPAEVNGPSEADTAMPYFRAPNRQEGGVSDSPTRDVWYRRYVGTDHAAKWETAYLMYLRPDCVDMSVYLGREAEPLTGVNGIDPRASATVEIGRNASELIVEGMIHKAEDLIRQAGG